MPTPEELIEQYQDRLAEIQDARDAIMQLRSGIALSRRQAAILQDARIPNSPEGRDLLLAEVLNELRQQVPGRGFFWKPTARQLVGVTAA